MRRHICTTLVNTDISNLHSQISPFENRLDNLAGVQIFQRLIQRVCVINLTQLVDWELALLVPFEELREKL